MKQKYLSLFGLFVVIAVGITACKKDRLPVLIITVTEQDGTPVGDAIVHVYPPPSTDIADSNKVINVTDMDKTATTFADGTARFEFKYSAVLNVEVNYISPDSTMFLSGADVVKVEVLRQRSKTNDVEETIEVL